MTHSQKQDVETQNKAVPFEVIRGWTGVPNAIYTVYSKHPEMNWTATAVYGYLLHRHNAKFGYAYPAQETIAIDLGVSTGTVKTAIRKLRKVGLIDVKFSVQYNNNHYFFPEVCETIEALEEKFPEISDHLALLEKRAEAIREEAEKDRYRLRGAYRGE